MDGLVFGLIDQGVMILGAMAGLNIEQAPVFGALARFLVPKRLVRSFGAILGAGVGNALSDGLAGWADGGIGLGAMTGCVLALVLLVPWVLYQRVRNRC